MGYPLGGMDQQDSDISSVATRSSQFLRGIFLPATSGKLYAEGMILGRVAASQKLTPCDQGAADGSEVPMGVTHLSIQSTLTNDISIDFIAAGGVNKAKIFFDDDDDVDELTVDKLRHFGITPDQVLALDKFDNS